LPLEAEGVIQQVTGSRFARFHDRAAFAADAQRGRRFQRQFAFAIAVVVTAQTPPLKYGRHLVPKQVRGRIVSARRSAT
jgi:hypothetical protein